jgi:hypothetical protein
VFVLLPELNFNVHKLANGPNMLKKIIVFSLIQLYHLSIGFTETGHSSIGSDQPSTGSSYMMWLMAAAAVAFATGVAVFVTDPEFFVRFFRS